MFILNAQQFNISTTSIDNYLQEQKKQIKAQEDYVTEILIDAEKILNYKKYLIFKILNVILYLLIIMFLPLGKINLELSSNEKIFTIIKNTLKEQVWSMVIALIVSVILYIISIKIISFDIFNILNTDLGDTTTEQKYPVIRFVIVTLISRITMSFAAITPMLLFKGSYEKVQRAMGVLFFIIQTISTNWFTKRFNQKNWQYIYDNYGFWRIILIGFYIIICNTALLGCLFNMIFTYLL